MQVQRTTLPSVSLDATANAARDVTLPLYPFPTIDCDLLWCSAILYHSLRFYGMVRTSLEGGGRSQTSSYETSNSYSNVLANSFQDSAGLNCSFNSRMRILKLFYGESFKKNFKVLRVDSRVWFLTRISWSLAWILFGFFSVCYSAVSAILFAFTPQFSRFFWYHFRLFQRVCEGIKDLDDISSAACEIR